MRPHEAVHYAPVNHVDETTETTWKRKFGLEWLWLLCNNVAAFFMIHPHRSKEAFENDERWINWRVLSNVRWTFLAFP
ncbi:MAG: transposase [Desulfovibrio sp.]|jgi:hypothetical protein|nr:transposase [Desulfovibrio sp.]